MRTFLSGLRPALIAFAIILYLDLVGFPLKFGSAAIWVFATVLLLVSFIFNRRASSSSLVHILTNSLIIGLVSSLSLALVTYVFARMQVNRVTIQDVFAQILPPHTAALTGLSSEQVLAGESVLPGLVSLALVLTSMAVLGGVLSFLPYEKLKSPQGDRTREVRGTLPLLLPLLFFAAYLSLRLSNVQLFGSKENIFGLLLLYVFFGASLFALRAIQPGKAKTAFLIVAVLGTLSVPLLNDQFQNSVLGFVFIFIIMGIGLNIVVGFAGLLDLGYVAFFAVGAYSYGLLSSPTAWVLVNVPGFDGISFWAGLPIAILMGLLAGILLGIPVLRLRGDYLAIVTLGFGEIIRLILLNLREFTDGPSGVRGIPPPYFFGVNLGNPRDLLFLAMVVAAIVTFIALRLRDSRIGRSWVAMREDETVAQAMGINLVSTKLLAFAFGAMFASLSGVLYAARQVNVYPDNFALDVSINVLALIIIGGIGSIEGVVIGAIALIGLPEILRSVNEYRVVAFGALLVAMMALRPEGLLPSLRRKRELHRSETEGLRGTRKQRL
jgi:branched-chain amino acid transport system permease protein